MTTELTAPSLGIKYGAPFNEQGWNIWNDENWLRIDLAVQLSVLSATTAAQPGSPTHGDRYILPVGSTGAEWAGNDGKVARFFSGSWTFYTPRTGWRAYVADQPTQANLFVYNGSAWVLAAGNMLKSVYDPTNINGSPFVRGNHTGTQLAATISDFVAAVSAQFGNTSFDTEVANNPTVVANTAKVSATGSIDTHSDVDVSTTPPVSGDLMKFNGTNWVPYTPKRRVRHLTFEDNSNPFVDKNGAGYKIAGYFIFRGSNNEGTISAIKAIYSQSGGGSVRIQVRDLTNAQTICSATFTGVGTTPVAGSLGTISNVNTTGDAVWLVEFDDNGTAGNARLHALELEFVGP